MSADSEAIAGIGRLTGQILVYAGNYPRSSARTIAHGIGEPDVWLIFALLKQAERAGQVHRMRTGNRPWLWELTAEAVPR